MVEFFCKTFLVAFFFFYSALFLVLLGRGICGAVSSRLKKARRARAPEHVQGFSLSPQTDLD